MGSCEQLSDSGFSALFRWFHHSRSPWLSSVCPQSKNCSKGVWVLGFTSPFPCNDSFGYWAWLCGAGGSSSRRQVVGHTGYGSFLVASKMVYQTGPWEPHWSPPSYWPNQTFLCWMIDLLYCFQNKYHLIWLNREFHLDLQWWVHLLDQWQRVSF